MSESGEYIPSANELSEIVFGKDLSEVINIPQMYEFAKARLSEAEDRGNVDEINLWTEHLGLIVSSSPDLRTAPEE